MRYRVRALDRNHRLHTEVIEAIDEADAQTRLHVQQLVLISINAIKPGSLQKSGFDLLLFSQELHALLSAGLSLIEGLEALVEKDTSPVRTQTLTHLMTQLQEGERLSNAMRKLPNIFPPLFVGIVQSAEGTSNLPQSLQRYIAYETKIQIVRHKIVSASIYPAILLVVGIAVSFFLLGYVVPKFSVVYGSSNRELPWASQLLMHWGSFVAQNAAALSAAIVTGLGIALWLFWRRPSKDWFLSGLQFVPGGKDRLETLALSRLYLTLGMLLEGGIPLLHGLRLSRVVLDPTRQVRLDRACMDVESGHVLSEALQRHEMSSPIAFRLLRVGEQSGEIGQMLTRAAEFHETETSRWIERFTKAFEPILMAAIGIVIGLIVILLYMPIFDLAGSLQ